MNTALLLMTALVLASPAQGQRPHPPPAPGRLPEITSEGEGDFHDLVFAVAGVTRAADGSEEVTAVGAHKGRPVRFQAVVAPTWEHGQVADRRTYSGVVTLRSLGADSDALVRIIDTLYGAKVMPKRMAPAVPFAAISLKGNPLELAAGEVALKLFFESESEERYAELYLNIDLARSRVELREKDEGYRGPVVRALSLGPEAALPAGQGPAEPERWLGVFPQLPGARRLCGQQVLGQSQGRRVEISFTVYASKGAATDAVQFYAKAHGLPRQPGQQVLKVTLANGHKILTVGPASAERPDCGVPPAPEERTILVVSEKVP